MKRYSIYDLESVLNKMEPDDPSRYLAEKELKIEKEFQKELESFKKRKK